MHTFHSAAAEVIQGLPGVLGFVPTESLVVVTVKSDEVDCVMRLDLAEAVHAGALDQVADLVVRAGADRAVAVIVSADGALCQMCGDDYRKLIEDLSRALWLHGGRPLDGYVVDRIATGGRWHCVDENCDFGGVLSDPAASVMAAAAVAAGRRMYGSRDELAASVASDATRAAVLAPMLDAVSGTAVECVGAAAGEAVDAARRMAGGAVLTDAELVGVGASLTDGRVRDQLYALADSATAVPVEALWALLARVLPQPWRGEALTLQAFSAFLRGDGPLAGIALAAALTEDPGHRMANMLDTALQAGFRPAEMRGLLGCVSPGATV